MVVAIVPKTPSRAVYDGRSIGRNEVAAVMEKFVTQVYVAACTHRPDTRSSVELAMLREQLLGLCSDARTELQKLGGDQTR